MFCSLQEAAEKLNINIEDVKELIKEGKNPLQIDSKAPSIPLEDYIYNENRYNVLRHRLPDEAAKLLVEAQEDVTRRWKIYEHMASMKYGD